MALSQAEIEAGVRLQANMCRALGAPFTAAIIEAAADDYASGGVLAELLHDWREEPMPAALGLRLAGAFQYIARSEPESGLGALYRALDANPDPETVRRLIADTARSYAGVMSDYIARAVQTNEVLRSAALLGGFLEAAKQTGLPLDLYEIGASAGLLLNWDQYAYDFGSFGWGRGAQRLSTEWKGPHPDWPQTVRVAGRRGCDISPVDYRDDKAVARAVSYIWVEQADRRERYIKAVATARDLKPEVEQADAGDWLATRLEQRPDYCTAVVYHSVMMQYLSGETREKVRGAIEKAARSASTSRPLAWLRFEPDEGGVNFAVDLTVWPGGSEQRLAYAHPHGAWVEWLGA